MAPSKGTGGGPPLQDRANLQKPGCTTYVIDTNSWSGGTVYASYTDAAANTSITGGQQIGFNPATDGDSYTFIVDSETRSYTITDHVTYANGASGDSTVTFTSVAPSGSISVAPVGDQGYFYDPGTGYLYLGTDPINFRASAVTEDYTDGDFMFLQIINSSYIEWTGNFGNGIIESKYLKNNIDWTNDPLYPDGQNFAGPLHDAPNLGYSFAWTDGVDSEPGGNSWHMGVNWSVPTPDTSMQPLMRDAPSMQPSATGLTKITRTDSFSTYLMYRPSGGVWIAISEVDWGWTVTATKVSGTWPGSSAPMNQPGAATTPFGEAAFPTWVNTGDNFIVDFYNPLRSGSPGP